MSANDLDELFYKSLLKEVNGAIDNGHAVSMLLEKGLIHKKAVRNICILEDYNILRKNPLNSMSDIYAMLSIKYEVSTDLIIKVVLKTK